MPVQIQAKSVTSGTDDNGNKWTYHTSTKTLTFAGNKAISDFTLNGHDREPSWYRWSNICDHIVIEEGITCIGSEAFAGFVKVLSVNIPYTVKKIKRNSFENNYKYVKEYVQKADLAIANLETTLAGNDVYNYSSYPTFNTPDSLADALKDTGFDLLSTINNHSFDMSSLGV